MEFNFTKTIVILIIVIIIGIKIVNSLINRNMKMGEKSDDSIKELEKNKSESKIIGAIIIINVIFGLLFPFSVMGAIVSPMTFDAPGSTEDFFNWIFFYATFSFSVVILMATITSLIFLFILKSYKKALEFSILPMLNIMVVIFFILFTVIYRKFYLDI